MSLFVLGSNSYLVKIQQPVVYYLTLALSGQPLGKTEPEGEARREETLREKREKQEQCRVHMAVQEPAETQTIPQTGHILKIKHPSTLLLFITAL